MTSLRRWQAALFASWAAGLGAMFGCPGTLDDPDRFRPPVVVCDPDASICGDAGTSTVPTLVTTAQVQAAILTPKCAFAGCHGNTGTQGMLDLSGDPGMLEARVIEVRSATLICGGRTIVVPGNPDRSLMITKLTTTATLCGTQMPQGLPLTQPEKDLLRQWITDLGVP